MYTLEIPVPALAKARPESDPCGGPLKVIVQSKKKKKKKKKKKGIASWYTDVNLEKKLKLSIFSFIIYF